MKNVNPSSPPRSPTLPISRRVQRLDKLLESLGKNVPPLISEPSYLEGKPKFELVVGDEERRKFIASAYIDLDFPMNIMSLAYYRAIRNQEYEHGGLNFVGIGKDMHVLSQVVFGRPFVETTKLILNKEKRSITFMDGINEVTFKTPYIDSEMEDLTSEWNDLMSSRVILSDDDFRRGCESQLDLEDIFYKDIDKLGPDYN
ncbi:hypothetical protein Tco_1428854 [Tanacetum coccineum]